MNKLQELIKTLKAFTILIIENEFSYIEDPKLILGGIYTISEEKRFQILDELELKEYTELSSQLRDFNDKWNNIQNHDNETFEKIGTDYLDKYLEKIGHEEIIKTPLGFLTDAIKADEDNKLKSIFLKNGIFIHEAVPKYKEILETIQSITECKIIIRKERPTHAEWDEFKSEVEAAISQTHSHFCLSIIDKSLGGGMQEGKELINDLIKEHKNDERFNHICCLYTSTASPVSLINYEDYFVQEISKNGANSIDDIALALAQSAYAEVFNSLRVKTVKSAEDTLKIVLKNQKNIKYIIDKSHEEGISAYDAIKYWNELSIRNEFDSRELNDFKFIAGLTSFFNGDYLVDHPGLPEVGKELKGLNTYELFDYSINKKHLPIAPGDIWEANGQYYILIGQLCDLLLRGKTNKRKAKLGEFFQINFGKHNKQEHKFEIVVENGKKKIYIDYFLKIGAEKYETINIDIATPNIFFADLQVLDLCMFNDLGKCKIDIGTNLDDSVCLLLPAGKDLYYDELKAQYSKVAGKGVAQFIQSHDISGPIKFPKFIFQEDGQTFDHQIRRVCRLKGRYFDSLYNNYLNNKGRIDLNLIGNIEEEVEVITLVFELCEDPDTRQEIKDFGLYTSRQGKYIKLSDLKIKLPQYEKLFSYAISDKLTIESKLQYELTENGAASYTLQYKYHLNIDDYKAKAAFSYKDLYNKQKPENNENFQIVGSENLISFVEDGHAKRKLTIQELKTGVIVFDKNQKLQLVNGVLERTEHAQ